MLKTALRTILKNIPYNKALFLGLKRIGLPDKLSNYLNFKDKEYSVKVGASSFQVYSNGLIQDNRLFWRGIEAGESYTTMIWQYLCKNSNAIVDVGANIGVFALIAKTINSLAEVHGFEPMPETFKKFKKNVEVNNYDIRCHEIALSDKNGTMDLFVSEGNDQEPSLNQNSNADTKLIVQTRQFDSYSREQNIGKIDLLKIDVESYEPEVLEGMKEMVDRDRPTIIIEVLKNETGARDQKYFEGKGYRYFYIDEQKGLAPSKNLVRLSKSRNYLVCQTEIAERILKHFASM